MFQRGRGAGYLWALSAPGVRKRLQFLADRDREDEPAAAVAAERV
jgi:hypothetical protein